MITSRGGMNIIPEKILVRIHPRLALGRINSVDEAVAPGLAQYADHTEPHIEGINGNPAPGEAANGRSDDGIELIAIISGGEVKCRHPGRITERIRNRAKRRNIRDEEISCAGIGQALNQNADAFGGIDHALRAVIIEEIITTAPEDVQRISIRGVTGQVIGNLLAHVVDGNGEIATAKGRWIIDDGAILRPVFGGSAAKCVIGSSIEAVLRD